MIYGAIPFKTFKQKNKIVNQLKKEFKRVKIYIVKDMVYYEAQDKYCIW